MSTLVERRSARLIGDDALACVLIQQRLVPALEVERCFEEAVERGEWLEEVLLRRGLLDEEELLRILESCYFCPAIDPRDRPFDPELLRLVPGDLARRLLALPVELDDDGGPLRVALARPDQPRALRELERAAGLDVQPLAAPRHALGAAIDRAYGRLREMGLDRPACAPSAAVPTGREADEPASAPSTPLRPAPAPEPEPAGEPTATLTAGLSGRQPRALVDGLLREALRLDATDVHFEPAEHFFGVRLRVDGLLRRAAQLPPELAAPVASRLKVIGGMDIAERRAPQDGRVSLKIDEQELDLRISALPSRHGEKIVLRLLRRDMSLLRLENLKMPPDVTERHADMLSSPQGLFLVTGPTGSGKTTTLYATLNALDRSTSNVVTLEDPIEYALPGITQVQVNEAAGLGFADGLRSILRQDPDVILVGEIRDPDTVQVACRAALTGHAVFSTLHANDSCQAVTRLVDMNVAPSLVAATLRGALAQRLLRLVCESCGEWREANAAEAALLEAGDGIRVRTGPGCAACGGSGHRGRMGVFEALRMEDELRRLILDSPSPVALRNQAMRRGMRTLLEQGRSAALEGLTSPCEVQRVLLTDDGQGAPCPGCGRRVAEEHARCPFCRRVLHEACQGCGTSVEPDWQACPRCGEAVEHQAPSVACGRCAAALRPSWTGCPYCGEAR